MVFNCPNSRDRAAEADRARTFFDCNSPRVSDHQLSLLEPTRKKTKRPTDTAGVLLVLLSPPRAQ